MQAGNPANKNVQAVTSCWLVPARTEQERGVNGTLCILLLHPTRWLLSSAPCTSTVSTQTRLQPPSHSGFRSLAHGRLQERCCPQDTCTPPSPMRTKALRCQGAHAPTTPRFLRWRIKQTSDTTNEQTLVRHCKWSDR